MRRLHAYLLTLVIALAGCGLAAPREPATAAGALVVTDVAGRQVSLPAQPRRVLLGESRSVYTTLILNRADPLDRVVAWGTDLQRAAPDIYAKLAEHVPAARDIPTVGSVASGDLSVEAVVSHRPDVMVLTLDSYRAAERSGFTAKLDAAGVRYVVTDYRVDPLRNTVASVRLLGQIFGRGPQAEEFVRYYEQQVSPILATAQRLETRPSVYLWRAPGLQPCCSTYGKANFGGMIDAAGGRNVGTALLPGDEGALTPEQILASQPDAIVATGGEWGAQKLSDRAQTSYLRLGYAADPDSARASLRALGSQPGFDSLHAFEQGRVYGVYHQFYDSPYNFVALMAFARWSQPDAFGALDPARTWTEFHHRFMPWEASGTFVVGLGEGGR